MKTFSLLFTALLAVSPFASGANEHTHDMKSMDMKSMDMKSMDMKSMDMKSMGPKMMDKDGDGMISRSEFMNAHEMMFDRMKNSTGMIAVKDMESMKKNMMGKHGMDCPKAHP